MNYLLLGDVLDPANGNHQESESRDDDHEDGAGEEEDKKDLAVANSKGVSTVSSKVMTSQYVVRKLLVRT